MSAEQHLLRVIGFDFELAAKNTDELKTVLVLSHQLRCKLSFKIVPPMLAQVLVNTYNDIGGMNVQERKI